ncbi:hypothetical protein [Mesorhizobium sp. L-8-3]|uniref:hypothetical protein n=1 Tax=Mesorhizobium sp. L-8-3 TaxID=2744522 RepID=UPI0019291468|nr:hypothetical protein [Mesorhizobium sp. L-8-3]BCH20628.1 hypothetical protein MesoLjLb_04130 [Mesorhizobium sp. L-8-3]
MATYVRHEQCGYYPYPPCYSGKAMGLERSTCHHRLNHPAALQGARVSWLISALLFSVVPAFAGNNSIGLEIANDREADDFSESKDVKYQIDGAHTFDNGVILAGSFQYTDPARGGKDSQNVEATIGYRLLLGQVFSVVGSSGIGARFSGSDDVFAYYVLKVGADLRMTDRVTWNAIGYRYRNAFDTDNDYDTPQLSTGLSFKVDHANSVSTKFYRSWKDGNPDETGLALGFKHEF